MRYDKLFTAVLIFVSAAASAQEKNFLDPDSQMTWLGIDFTKAKFIGTADDFFVDDVPRLLRSWNDLMLKEKDKYNTAEMLHRKDIDISLDVVMTHNEEHVSLKYLYENDPKKLRRLDRDSIQSIVSGYDFTGLSGYGLMFNVESFHKGGNVALVWVTFVNMDSRKVLFTQRMSAPPKGFGLRNYWASSIYMIIKTVEGESYRRWKKELERTSKHE